MPILKATVEIDYDEKLQEVSGIELVLPTDCHWTIALNLFHCLAPGCDRIRDILVDDPEYLGALQYMLAKHDEELKIEQQLDNTEIDKS